MLTVNPMCRVRSSFHVCGGIMVAPVESTVEGKAGSSGRTGSNFGDFSPRSWSTFFEKRHASTIGKDRCLRPGQGVALAAACYQRPDATRPGFTAAACGTRTVELRGTRRVRACRRHRQAAAKDKTCEGRRKPERSGAQKALHARSEKQRPKRGTKASAACLALVHGMGQARGGRLRFRRHPARLSPRVSDVFPVAGARRAPDDRQGVWRGLWRPGMTRQMLCQSHSGCLRSISA